MKTRIILTVTALLTTVSAAAGENYGLQSDRDGRYSQSDQRGYDGREGQYRQMLGQDDRRGFQDGAGTRYDHSTNHYRQGEYEQNCRRGNVAAGTIFGAAAGGLLGSAVSHGNGGAVVGGVVLGGLIGNTVVRDISCEDQPYAFQAYAEGLNGNVGRRYDWNRGEARGSFQPIREYRRSGTRCRDFTETTWHGDRAATHTGTACRAADGRWRFD